VALTSGKEFEVDGLTGASCSQGYKWKAASCYGYVINHEKREGK
jgi:hypothetical protein